MKRTDLFIPILALAAILIAALSLGAWICPSEPYDGADRDVLFQVSPIDALLEGTYDGVLTFGELKKHGDFGIGTFDALDGEMIAADGIYYQARADGSVSLVSDTMTTPFATVTFFDPDQEIPIDRTTNFTEMIAFLDEQIPSPNLFYAVRVDGTYTSVKVRAFPLQNKPYNRLVDAVAEEHELHEVNGTIVGFYTPTFVQGLNVPGYHLHFISEEKDAGGHILDFSLRNGIVKLDTTPGFHMMLPAEGEFCGVNLTGNLTEELEAVER
jgi:acetolactate decarboxylase